MKRIFFLLAILFTACIGHGQHLYIKAFGNPHNPPIIFLHGGPGSSAVYFEATTVQQLANRGFYVIIYDRRGEGRSVDKNARINYAEAFADLNGIYRQYGFKKANLIGFSFGGLVTSLYASKYPEKVQSIIFVSALISQQASYNTILRSVRSIYEKQHNTTQLKAVALTEKMDTNSLAYRTSCFGFATENGFFKLEKPDSLARSIYAACDTNTLITRYVKNKEAVQTFWKNEPMKNIDVSDHLRTLRLHKINIYALYGKQDGLYSDEQLTNLQSIIGNGHLKHLDNCSHTLFIDQQVAFLDVVEGWVKHAE